MHLSEDEQTAIAVGQRYGKPIVLKIEALRMYQQGCKFFQAENGVWLTILVPTKYLIINTNFSTQYSMRLKKLDLILDAPLFP